MLDGIQNGFQLLPKDAKIQPAEMHNYNSTTNPAAREKVEASLLSEIEAGNYVPVPNKPTIVSALGAVPKPDSDDLRLIHDCSMPPKKGVNTYINIEKQKFQTIDDAVSVIKKGYYLAKVDLRHAYRSVPTHPSNYHEMGLKWKFKGARCYTYFVDTRLPFGGKSAPGIFHRLTQAVRRMMQRRGFVVIVYLDDFLVVAETKEECQEAYDTLCSLLLTLGFQLSNNKLVPPCQQLIFLGVLFNTLNLTLSLPPAKLLQLSEVVSSFMSRTRASKRQLQQLAGRLNWACKVVFGGRTFLRRVLDLMNSLPTPASQCRLSLDFHRDMVWWHEFLDTFNGQCEFHDLRPITDLQTDACTEGVGAFHCGDWFYSNFYVDHPELAHFHINYKEALCVVFAAMRWAPYWSNKTVHVFCDNTAAVAMLNKATTRSPLMMVFLRKLFWLSATYNFRLKAFHVPGRLNIMADHVSRLHESDHLLGFLAMLQNFLPYHVSMVDAFSHMSLSCYYFLCGRFMLGL